MQNYFTLDPKLRRENLFAALIPAGLQMMAASAPTTQPGGFMRGLGQAGQSFMQNMNTFNNQALNRQAMNLEYNRGLASDKRADERFAWQQKNAADTLAWRDQNAKAQRAAAADLARYRVDNQNNGTGLQKDYEYAVRGGYKGSFTDYAMMTNAAKGGYMIQPAPTVPVSAPGPAMPASTVPQNAPTVPASGAKFVPIPGSPAAIAASQQKIAEEKAAREAAEAQREEDEDAKAAETNRANQERSASVVTEEINRSLDLIEESPNLTTGIFGNALSGFQNTDAGALRNRLMTIKSNIGFDRLQQMRAGSKTGAALGSISDSEVKTLQAVYGSLEQAQDDAELTYNLKRLHNLYQDTVHGPGSGPERYDLSKAGGTDDSGLMDRLKGYTGQRQATPPMLSPGLRTR